MRAEVGHFYRHKKTGGIYCVLHMATIEADKMPAIVYRSEKHDTIWVRPEAEFCDGRFEKVTDFREVWPEK